MKNNGKSEATQELSFEYLFSKDNLKYVTIKSEQVTEKCVLFILTINLIINSKLKAILISMTIQSIIDEILMVKDGKTVKKFTERPKDKNLIPFLNRQKSLINLKSLNEPENPHEVKRNFSQNDLLEVENFISNDDL
jgi:hypothetical protein